MPQPAPESTPDRPWRIATDVGGTFTDAVAIDPSGQPHTAKVLSSGAVRARLTAVNNHTITISPEPWTESLHALIGATVTTPGEPDPKSRAVATAADPSSASITLDRDAPTHWEPGRTIELSTGDPAPLLAARLITRTPTNDPLPPCRLRLATTRATNALLTRDTPPCALFVTEGFEDLLRIGTQQRPHVYARTVITDEPLTEHVYPVPARVDPTGREVVPLDEAKLRAAAAQALDAGATSAAVCLIGAWADPHQERRAADILRDIGFDTVTASAELAPRIGLLNRARVATAEAALAPIISTYLHAIAAQLPDSEPDNKPDSALKVLTSAGGLAPANAFNAVDSLLSGPAGGVVGAAAIARDAGIDRVLTFDMGGTSTDVARVTRERSIAPAHRVGGVEIVRPAVAIETVAAGGGSICALKNGRIAVGPESAGATPGPACYGAGGPLTITDINLLAGRIDADAFEVPIDQDAAARALQTLRDELANAGQPIAEDDLIAGLLDIANESMAEAIRSVSVRRGYDPADHALVGFGGAGPQHACDVAARLNIETVLIPEHASVLSAVGLTHAQDEARAERTCLFPLDTNHDRVRTTLDELEAQARERLGKHDEIAIQRTARLRLVGQLSDIEVEATDVHALPETFAEHYRREHATTPDRPIEVVLLAVTARAKSEPPSLNLASQAHAPKEQRPTRQVLTSNGKVNATIIPRRELTPDHPIPGPALITQRQTQTWIPPGWEARTSPAGTLIAEARDAGDPARTVANDTLTREITLHRLAAIAGQMGDALERAAVSVNVKDRRDYSCAVHDAQGRVVSSADHIPVHLGALGVCVRRVLEQLGPLEPGAAALTNHPAFGGSHLPDLTVIQPVHTNSGELLGYVSSRAHHAEIGGTSPGSMPPGAASLAEEGVPIRPVIIAKDNEFLAADARELLTSHPWPTRAIDDNLADLGAAVAAGARAAAAVVHLSEEIGRAALTDAMTWVLAHTADLVRTTLRDLDLAESTVSEHLDGGAELHVRTSTNDGELTIDFTGTSPVQHSNLNTPLAVTRSAVAYVVRLLLDRDISMNDGLLDAVRLIVPEGCMLNPEFGGDDAESPPVAGGNVETSQRIVEALMRAFGLGAGGAGTMNNVLVGNDTFGVYETLGSGCGASESRDGAHGVHQHMSNTAITDAEVLEHRHPLRVRRFAVRTGSGGSGGRRGGDGLVRELEALEPVTVSLVTQRRAEGAPGAHGGEAGRAGINRVVRADGSVETLAWAAQTELAPGDRVVIETPGGGGWGEPSVEADAGVAAGV